MRPGHQPILKWSIPCGNFHGCERGAQSQTAQNAYHSVRRRNSIFDIISKQWLAEERAYILDGDLGYWPV